MNLASGRFCRPYMQYLLYLERQLMRLDVKHVFNRNGIYQFRIVVPLSHRRKFKRREFWHSLGTRSENEAAVKAASLLTHYRNLFSATEISDLERPTFDELTKVSDRLGVKYQPALEVELASIRDSVSMMAGQLKMLSIIQTPDHAEIAALGGVVDKPAMTISQALQRYINLNSKKLEDGNYRESEKKYAVYREAVNNFISLMGDLDVLDITATVARDYKLKLAPRLDAPTKKEGLIAPATANKKFMWLKVVVKEALRELAPDRAHINPFDNLDFEAKDGKRVAFTEAEARQVRAKIQGSKANEELKCIALVGELTGATCKEIGFLTKDDIHLEAPIPYISIQPNALRSKTKAECRVRDIPLLPAAVKALKKFPNGFQRYDHATGPEAFSAMVNKLIRKVTPDKTFYCYRHLFADRLRNSGCNDTLKNSLMGHSSAGMMMRYGAGYDLKNKLEALQKAFPDEINQT
ncbi:integrase [Agrobacterium rosae]|uniref:Integrase n=2 Tax=Agrobacterium rosae TaxID=1972867 RepID=A0AAE5VPX0_9HYPH|nr:integrase [Agrobacterium rosae]KAA3518988.1 integrase [Agrobacterium rosae]MQB49284.1 integrase [Agrobacterium rosae]POO51810.1 integrase [Agrobacterium rosae]